MADWSSRADVVMTSRLGLRLLRPPLSRSQAMKRWPRISHQPAATGAPRHRACDRPVRACQDDRSLDGSTLQTNERARCADGRLRWPRPGEIARSSSRSRERGTQPRWDAFAYDAGWELRRPSSLVLHNAIAAGVPAHLTRPVVAERRGCDRIRSTRPRRSTGWSCSSLARPGRTRRAFASRVDGERRHPRRRSGRLLD